MKKQRAIVTGASGHLGFHVARKLLEEGIATDVLVRSINANVAELQEKGARVFQVDLRDSAKVVPLLTGAQVLFHLAAENTTDTSQVDEILESTVRLTTSVISSALAAAVPTIVYTSSVVVLGRSPDRHALLSEKDRTTTLESPYVRGKVEADRFCEDLINERGTDIRRVYPSWVVGPGDLRGTPPHRTIDDYLKKGQKFWFNGGISIAGVEQVAAGHVNAWRKGQPQGQYVLGGTNLTFREFFGLLAKISGHRSPWIFLPKVVVVFAARLLKFIGQPFGKKSPLDPAYAQAVIGAYSWYDSSHAIRELGYEIPDVQPLFTQAVRLEKMRLAGTYSLGRVRQPATAASAARNEERPLLITGVPGWIGNRFIDILMNGLGPRAASTRRVHLLVEPRLAGLLDLPARFKIFPGDLNDTAVLREALAGVGTVIHLAGAIYPPKISTLYKVNTEGTKTLVDACIAAGVRRFLFMSTDSVCGHGTPEKRLFDEKTLPNPYRNYGASKYLAEKYLFEKTAAGEIDGTVLRGFWFFGPFAPARQNKFLGMMRRRRQIVFGNGKNYRSISHVDNIVTAFSQVEKEPKSIGKWYWIGNAKEDYTVDDIYRILCHANGNVYRPIYLPGMICGVMRGIDWLLGRMGRLHPTVHGIGKLDFDIGGSIAAAQRDFGYQPVTSLTEYAEQMGKKS